MTRLLFVLTLFTLAPHANADPTWRDRGIRGTVTAYDLDGSLIDRKYCHTRYRSRVVDYGTCTARLRDEVKAKKCGRYAAGTHHFYFQHGDGRPYRSSVYCSRRS